MNLVKPPSNERIGRSIWNAAFGASGAGRKSDLMKMKRKERHRWATGIALVLTCTWATLSPVRAASAVAIALDPRTGHWQYGYWHSPSESDAKDRALRISKALGGANARILASTSRRGCGAIVAFEGADKKTRFSVSLAANTEQLAVKEALQKAKAAGGRYAKVLKTWNDLPSKTESNIIKL